MAELPFDSCKIRKSIRGLKEFYSGVLALARGDFLRGL